MFSILYFVKQKKCYPLEQTRIKLFFSLHKNILTQLLANFQYVLVLF